MPTSLSLAERARNLLSLAPLSLSLSPRSLALTGFGGSGRADVAEAEEEGDVPHL